MGRSRRQRKAEKRKANRSNYHAVRAFCREHKITWIDFGEMVHLGLVRSEPRARTKYRWRIEFTDKKSVCLRSYAALKQMGYFENALMDQIAEAMNEFGEMVLAAVKESADRFRMAWKYQFVGFDPARGKDQSVQVWLNPKGGKTELLFRHDAKIRGKTPTMFIQGEMNETPDPE